MPHNPIARPLAMIRSVRQATTTGEPRRARRARTAGQRKLAAAAVLLAVRVVLGAAGAHPLALAVLETLGLAAMVLAAQQLGWARGFTARHRTPPHTVTIDLDELPDRGAR